MNKTLRSIAAASCLAAALSFGGCANGNAATNEILDRLDTMQQELDELKTDINGSSSGSTDAGGSPSDTGTGSDTGTDPAAAPTDASGFDTAIADLETRVAEAVATADAVAVPANAADRPQAYFDATRPLEALDDEVDRLDDQVENAHRAHTIDRGTMWSLEDRLDAVDDQLDHAKDSLERRMGVDD